MDQFIFADKPAIVLYQILQDFKRLGAQLDLFLRAQQTAAPQIERELAKGEYLVRQLLHENVRQTFSLSLPSRRPIAGNERQTKVCRTLLLRLAHIITPIRRLSPIFPDSFPNLSRLFRYAP